MTKLPKDLKPKFRYQLIRLGGSNDGGYLVSLKSILATSTLISFGIGGDIEFEKDFLNKKKVIFLGYDNENYKQYFKRQILLGLPFLLRLKLGKFFEIILKYYRFIKFAKNNELNRLHITYNSLDDILKNKKVLEPFFFKVDIEGSEYRILESLLKIQHSICGLVIEFHDIDLNIERILSFVQNFNLTLTHIHANNFGKPDLHKNPTVIELTFEKDPIKIDQSVNIPSDLDNPNNPFAKDYVNYFD